MHVGFYAAAGDHPRFERAKGQIILMPTGIRTRLQPTSLTWTGILASREGPPPKWRTVRTTRWRHYIHCIYKDQGGIQLRKECMCTHMLARLAISVSFALIAFLLKDHFWILEMNKGCEYPAAFFAMGRSSTKTWEEKRPTRKKSGVHVTFLSFRE